MEQRGEDVQRVSEECKGSARRRRVRRQRVSGGGGGGARSQRGRNVKGPAGSGQREGDVQGASGRERARCQWGEDVQKARGV